MFSKCLTITRQVLTIATLLCSPALAIADVTEDKDSAFEGSSETLQVSVEDQEQVLAQIQSQLERLESSRNAYDIGISELSLELAAQYSELGYYDQSLEAYRRALHIARINYGLTSEEQLPILEQFLSLYEKAGHMEEADFIFRKMLLIYRENYDPWSPAVASLFERIGSWHLAAYYFEIDQEPVSHLVAANVALLNALSIGRAQRDSIYDFDMYNLLSLTNWALSTFYNRPNRSNDFSNDTLNHSPDSNTYISNSFRNGSSLLEEGMKAAVKTEDPENIARATLMYADWNQLFNMPQTARTHYIEAYKRIQQLDPDSPLRQSLAIPHALPNFDESEFSFRPQKQEYHEIALRFDVTEWGRPQKILIDNDATENFDASADRTAEHTLSQDEEPLSPEERERQLEEAVRKAINTVRNTNFRPAFIDGQPSDYQNVKRVILVAKGS